MSSVVAEPPRVTEAVPRAGRSLSARAVATPPQEFRWTPAALHRVGETGVFDGVRVELIKGRLIEMPPPGTAHVVARRLIENAIREVFKLGDGYVVDGQAALRLADSELQPDVLVFHGDVRDEPTDPEHVVLVCEVADSSLAFDRGAKLAVFAEQGYGEYWIVNVPERVLEVYRQPQKLPGGDWGYASRTVLTVGGVVRPLARPDDELRLADVLDFDRD